MNRAMFEKWTRDFYGDLACASDTWSDKKGTYSDFAHHMAWRLWCDMQSRLESLEKDAARYRWLRANWFTMSASYENNAVQFYTNGKRYSEASDEDLDATIDTAMKG